MTVLTIDRDDMDAIMALKRFVDPDGHIDPNVFVAGLRRSGVPIVNKDPGYLGARVTDRWGRTWQRITNHDDPMWMLEDGHSDLDMFHSIKAEYGPLIATDANHDPVPHPGDDS